MTTPEVGGDQLVELEAALRDGAARWIVRAVARDMRAQERANGGRPGFPGHVQRALELLEAIADGEVSAPGHPPAMLGGVTGMAPLVEAAAEVDCEERRARRAVSRGRVLGRKVGDRWLVDVDALRRYVDETDRRTA